MNNQYEERLGTERMLPLIFKMALPAVAAQFVNLLYNIVDRIYIGHIPEIGTNALAGVGVTTSIVILISSFSAIVGAGGAPLAAMALGQGDRVRAGKFLGNGFMLLILFTVLTSLVSYLFMEPILRFAGASAVTLPYAEDYLSVYLLGTLFVEISTGLNTFINSQGRPNIAMYSVLIGALLNIVLDPIFIFGFKMGVRGAALATVISQGISCIWVILFLRGGKTVLKLKRENIRFAPHIILPCIALGLATFIMQASESVISVCFNSSLLKYGGDIAVGAMTILTSVMQFAMLPLQGVAQGAQPILSYNFGAKNADRVKKTFLRLLTVSLCYSVALWAFVMLFPKTFAGIFSPNPELVNFTGDALRIYCGALFLFGIQIACQMTFVSIGNAGCSIIVAVLRKFVLLIPLIYIMPQLLADKTNAVYTAEPAADVIAVTCTAILFSIEFRKALKKLNSDSAGGTQPAKTDLRV